MPAPISTWVTTFMASAGKAVGMPPLRVGVTANANPRESTTFAMAGTDFDENGGTTASHDTIRIEARRYPMIGSPANVRVIDVRPRRGARAGTRTAAP